MTPRYVVMRAHQHRTAAGLLCMAPYRIVLTYRPDMELEIVGVDLAVARKRDIEWVAQPRAALLWRRAQAFLDERREIVPLIMEEIET